MLTRGYSGTGAYAQSKLAQIMFTIDLAHELAGSGVTVNALHPATYMNTTMVREGGITPISTVEQGGERSCTSPPATIWPQDRAVLQRPATVASQSTAYDAAARQRLRSLSFELTGLAPG